MLLRAAGSARVGLHSGEITSLASLARCLVAPLDLRTPHFRASDFIAPNTLRGHAARGLHTATAPSAAATAGDDALGQSLAEQYDLLPPDTGTVRIEGYAIAQP